METHKPMNARQSQADVDRLMEHARQMQAKQKVGAAAPSALSTRSHIGAFIAMLFSLLFWVVAIVCIANGWEWQFVLGFCLLTAAIVLWVRWPAAWRRR